MKMMTRTETGNYVAVFSIVCAVVALSANAQFFSPVPGPDASDILMRNQIMNLGADVAVTPAAEPESTSDIQSVPSPGLDASDTMIRNQLANIGMFSSSGSAEKGTLSGEKAGEMMKSMYSAIVSAEWEDALDKTIDYFNATRNSALEADLNRAQDLLYASMLSWNTDRKAKAHEFLDKSIQLMKTGENLGDGCEARAVAFRKKMSDGVLPCRFTTNDIIGNPGIQAYIMELPTAKFNKTISASIARYEAISGRADAQKGIYEAQGKWFEKSSKFYARQAYQNATHRTFDPDRPPERGTSAREHWEAAKRIYDIFGK